MNTVLETTPFSVSIELAAIASRRDFLNLEKWLQDNLTIHRDSFFQVGVYLLIPGVRYESMSLLSSLFIPSGVAVKLCSHRSLTVLDSFVWGLQVDNNSECKPISSSHQTCHEKFLVDCRLAWSSCEKEHWMRHELRNKLDLVLLVNGRGQLSVSPWIPQTHFSRLTFIALWPLLPCPCQTS